MLSLSGQRMTIGCVVRLLGATMVSCISYVVPLEPYRSAVSPALTVGDFAVGAWLISSGCLWAYEIMLILVGGRVPAFFVVHATTFRFLLSAIAASIALIVLLHISPMGLIVTYPLVFVGQVTIQLLDRNLRSGSVEGILVPCFYAEVGFRLLPQILAQVWSVQNSIMSILTLCGPALALLAWSRRSRVTLTLVRAGCSLRTPGDLLICASATSILILASSAAIAAWPRQFDADLSGVFTSYATSLPLSTTVSLGLCATTCYIDRRATGRRRMVRKLDA